MDMYVGFALDIVLGIVTLGGLFMLVLGRKKKNIVLSVAGAALAVVCGLVIFFSTCDVFSGSGRSDIVETFDQAAGHYIGTQLKGKKVLVILGDELPDGDAKMQSRMYEAFKLGFGAEVIEKKITRINTYGVSREEAIENFHNHFETLDEIYAEADAASCDVIVQFAGFSVPNRALGWDYDPTFPKNAKFLLMPHAIRLDAPASRKIAQDLFEQNLLYGIAAEKRGFNYKEEVPEDPTAAFNKRYLLITPDNKDSFPEYLEYSAGE